MSAQAYGLNVGRGSSKPFLLILQAHILKHLLFHGKAAKKSQKYAAIASPFKGLRVYQTAAMGMPGSEVALSELTSLLFGTLRQQGKLEILMDDIYIGGDTPLELLQNWKEVLKICIKMII